jgi:hypothetical protein
VPTTVAETAAAVVSQAVPLEDPHEVALTILVGAQRGAVCLGLSGGAQALVAGTGAEQQLGDLLVVGVAGDGLEGLDGAQVDPETRSIMMPSAACAGEGSRVISRRIRNGRSRS